MQNIYSYVREMGHLPFSRFPFNEADNLVFTVFCYLDLDEVIPPPGRQPVSFMHAARRYFRIHGLPETSKDDGSNSSDALQRLFLRMAKAPRYRKMMLSSYFDIFDPRKTEQLTVFCIHYSDQQIFIAYRGTSDSLMGWKEDFLLAATGRICSQEDALRYLLMTAHRYPNCRLDIGGHSKGGHLAVYAASCAPQAVQKQIDSVWCNDGPGFSSDFRGSAGYRRIAPKIHSYVPKASIASMLYPHSESYTVVDSCASGIVQHDAKTWIIRDGHLAVLPERTRQSLAAEKRIRSWLDMFSQEDLLHYVEILFDILYRTGAETFPELTKIGIRSLPPAVSGVRRLPSRDRQWLRKFLFLLLGTVRRLR